MDLTDPRFIQAFMRSKEAKTGNVPSVFNKLIQTSKSMKSTYEPEKEFLNRKFDRKTIPKYETLTKSFAKEQNLEKANKLKITILNFVENLSDYEIYLLVNEYENKFFGLRQNIINETTVEFANLAQSKLQKLIKRKIFIEQSKLLKEMIDFGVPAPPKILNYITSNIYIFADIFSRLDEDLLITNFDFMLSPNPLSKYQAYYERLFEQEMPFYDNQNKWNMLKQIKNYIKLTK
jgi:hypothetical protein